MNYEDAIALQARMGDGYILYKVENDCYILYKLF
jgi:hypothetical protein